MPLRGEKPVSPLATTTMAGKGKKHLNLHQGFSDFPPLKKLTDNNTFLEILIFFWLKVRLFICYELQKQKPEQGNSWSDFLLFCCNKLLTFKMPIFNTKLINCCLKLPGVVNGEV